jgi:hypothetical protein
MAIDFNAAREKVSEIKNLLSKLNQVITLSLNPKIYSNGNREIKMGKADKDKLALEYEEIRIELEAKVGELPEEEA